MELLSPQATQDGARAEEARSVLRLQALAEAEKELRIKLANAEADFNDTLAKNRSVWEQEFAGYQKIKQELEYDIAQLKKPSPIEEDVAREPVANLVHARELEAQAQEQLDLLEEKLDAVAEREQSVADAEEALRVRRIGVDTQAQAVKEMSDSLTHHMADFAAEKRSWEQQQKADTEAIFLLKRSVEGREFTLQTKERALEALQIELKDKEKELVAKEVELNQPIKEIEAHAHALMQEAEKKFDEVNAMKAEASKMVFETKNIAEREAKDVKRRSERLAKSEGALEERIKKLHTDEKELVKERSLFASDVAQHDAQKDILQQGRKAFDAYRNEVVAELDGITAAAENNVKEAAIMVREAKEREANATTIFDRATEQLQDACDLEIKNQHASEKLAQNLREYDLANTKLAQDEDALDVQREEFVVVKTELEKALSDREMKVSAREKAFKAKESKVTRQEKFLSEWALRLKDQEGALHRAKTSMGL